MGKLLKQQYNFDLDYEKEYFLKPFEIRLIKDGLKTIVIVPEGIHYNRVIHINGMALVVYRTFKKSLRKLSRDEFEKFGVKYGKIPAECEHPEFIRPYYGHIISSCVSGWADALRFYIEENQDCDWNIDKPYTMVEFSLHSNSKVY